MIAKAVVGFLLFRPWCMKVLRVNGFIREAKAANETKKGGVENEPNNKLDRYHTVQTEDAGSCEVDRVDLSQRGIDLGAV